MCAYTNCKCYTPLALEDFCKYCLEITLGNPHECEPLANYRIFGVGSDNRVHAIEHGILSARVAIQSADKLQAVCNSIGNPNNRHYQVSWMTATQTIVVYRTNPKSL